MPTRDAPQRPVTVEVTPELEQLVHDAMKLHVLAYAATRDFHGRVVRISGQNTTAYAGLGIRLSLDEPLPFDLAFNVRWTPRDFKRTYAGKKADSFTLVQGETQRDFQIPPDMIDDMLAELASWAGKFTCHHVKIMLEPAPERALKDPRVKAYWPKPIELPKIELRFRVAPNLYTLTSPADIEERKKELYSPDLVAKRMAAWDLSLVGFDGKQALLGVESKLVLLEAVRSDDELTSQCAFDRLQKKFREKIRTILLDAAKARRRNGKIDKQEWLKLCEQLRKSPRVRQEIMPVLQKAVEGLDDPGQIGRRCSAIAAEAWALNLLDDKAKRKIVKNYIEPVFNVRPWYPAGTDSIRLWLFSKMSGSMVRCSVRTISNIDGEDKETHFQDSVGGLSHVVNIKRPTLGRHTVRAKVEVASVRLDMGFEDLFEPILIEAYREEFRMGPVTFEVAEKLPDGYLQAKYEPQVAALIAKSVRMNVSKRITGSQRIIGGNHTIDEGYLPRLVIKEPLPVDLALCARWHIKETGKSYEGGTCMIVRGDRIQTRFGGDFRGPRLSFPYALSANADDMAQLGEQFTVRITLEPSLKAALWHPDIDSYWPRPIELPEFTVRIRRNEKTNSK